MNSKRGISITCGMLLLSGVLMAQTADQSSAAPANPNATAQTANAAKPHRAPDPARQAKYLGKKLNLSQDQLSQIQPILADRDQQIQTLRGDTSLTQTDRRAKMKSIHEDSNNKIEAVLNDQQKQQFEQMQQSQRGRRQSAPQAQ
jgi:periplasmic protein CpxP/Spy